MLAVCISILSRPTSQFTAYKYRQIDRYREVGRQTGWLAETDRHTDRQTDRQTGGQAETDSQAGGQAETDRRAGRQRQTDSQAGG